MTPRWTRALVTGATSGIGRALAVQLGDEGTDLIVVARDRERLEALAHELPVEVEVLPADLTVADDRHRIAARLADDTTPVDLLVNNAGASTTGGFTDLDVDDSLAVVDLNVVAVVELTHAAARAMSQRGGGSICNISSIAGWMPATSTGVYGATKSFVTSFSTSLHDELAHVGVSLTAVCPGLTHTEFHERAGLNVEGLPSTIWQDADEVARAALDAVADRRAITVTGWMNRVAVAGARVLPSAALRKMASLVR